MRILQSCGSQTWGGLEIQTLKISKALTEHGHRVILLCHPDGVLAREAAAAGLPLQHSIGDDRRMLSNIRQTRALLKAQRFDVVHTHLSHDLGVLSPALRLLTARPKYLLTKRMASGVSKKDLLHRWLYAPLDGIISISDFIRENVIATCPVAPEIVTTMHNGLEIERFQPGNVDPGAVRREFGLPAEGLIIGVVGRLTPKKGHREFLQAAEKLLQQSNVPLHFWIVGGASVGEEAYEQTIIALAEELAISDRITFSGFQKDVSQILPVLDIFVFPSYGEAFGNLLLEAMALERPIVASDGGAVPEIIEDGKTGLLAPAKSIEPLTEKMRILVEDAPLQESLGKAARQAVLGHFRFDIYIDRLIQYYQDLSA